MSYSFSFRGIRSEDINIQVLDVKRTILPPNNVVAVKIPGSPGELFLRSEYDSKQFVISILIEKQLTAAAIQEQAKLVANFLDTTQGPGELIFDDDPTQYYTAIIQDATPTDQITTFRTGTITFFVPQPFSSSSILDQLTLNGFLSTFTRNSLAYTQEGTNVVANQERYETAVYNEGVTIEEGTTNLLTATLSSFEDGATAAVGISATIGRDIKHTFHGNLNMKILTDGAGIVDEGFQSDYIPLSASLTYTLSLYCLANKAATLKLVVMEYTAAPALIATQTSTIYNINDENGDFVRMLFTFTTSGTTTQIKFKAVTNVTQYLTFWIDGIQLELNNYTTSWVMGAVARVNESLTLPLRSYLVNYSQMKEGTIEFIFGRMHPTSDTYAALIDWGSYSGTNALDRLVIYHGTSFSNGLRTLEFQMVNGATTAIDQVSIILPAITVQGQFYYVAVRWSLPGYLKIDVFDYTNNLSYSAIKTSVITAPTFASYPTAALGVSGSTFYVNAIYDDFRATKRARTDAEISAVAISSNNRPLPVDADGVVKVSFDQNLTLYSTDVSNMGTATIYPIVKIVLMTTATYVQILHNNTGKILYVLNAFNTGDVLIFDCQKRIVYLNGTTNMGILTIASEFFPLPKDDNVITPTSDGTIDTIIQYYPNWL
jgi:predicted phage tail component-like protein